MANVVANVVMSQLVERYARHKTGKSMIASGVMFLAFGLALHVFLYEFLLDAVLSWQMQLKDGGFIFQSWKDVPFPLKLQVYVFQIENGYEFQQGLELPRVTDIGPFYFHEYRNRDILDWPLDGGVVRFNERLRFVFDERRSIAPLSQPVKVVNTPLLLILGFIDHKVHELYLSMFSSVINNAVLMIFRSFDERLVEDRTVAEILTGRSLGILRLLDTLTTPLRSMGIDIPDVGVGFYKLSQQSFGFIHLRHNQTFGPTAVFTGQKDIGPFNHFYSYNGLRSLPFYRHEYCNRLRGTEGTFFGARPPRNRSQYIFNAHLCHPIRLNYIKESTYDWIFTYRYQMDPYQFSPKSRTENFCYCPASEESQFFASGVSRCEGVFYMNQCLDGSPLVLSNVHFIGAPHLKRAVQGLRPQRQKHLGYLELESTLGASVDVALRVQLNIDMKPYSMVPSLNQFQPVIMPYLWIEEGARVEGSLKTLLTAGSVFFKFNSVFFMGIASFGGLLLVAGVTRFIKRRILKRKVHQQQEQLLPRESLSSVASDQSILKQSPNEFEAPVPNNSRVPPPPVTG